MWFLVSKTTEYEEKLLLGVSSKNSVLFMTVSRYKFSFVRNWFLSPENIKYS